MKKGVNNSCLVYDTDDSNLCSYVLSILSYAVTDK